MIDEARIERALQFLAETDRDYALAKTEVEATSILAKKARARIFLTGEGSVEARKAEAETHPEVAKADDQYIAALLAFEKLKAQRERAELVIEVWRTLEASRRKGL